METKKALFISQGITPYIPSTPAAEYGHTVARSILESGVEVRTFMPKYGIINERRNQLHEVIRLSGLNIVIDDTDHPLVIKVATLQPSRMQVYFIDNEDYFGYADPGKLETETSPRNNDERIMFFVRGIIETVKKLRWTPDVVQCVGWATALAPIYMRVVYADDPTIRTSKIVYTIYNNPFEGTLDPRFVDKLRLDGFGDTDLHHLLDGPADTNALHRIAIDYADAIVIDNENIPDEIVQYAKASGKPLLDNIAPAEDGSNPYLDFYNSL